MAQIDHFYPSEGIYLWIDFTSNFIQKDVFNVDRRFVQKIVEKDSFVDINTVAA